MIALTRDKLARFAPVARPDLIDALVEGSEDIRQAGITTPLRLQHFLTQIAVETGGLRAIEENMRYSARRLMQVWPSRFPTLKSAQPYAMNPEKLAEKVYGGRLGNVHPGDGWRYRGGSMIQTTGRYNYRAAGHENDPEVLREDPSAALRAALRYWQDKGCNAFADRDDLNGLRRVVNGGLHGIADCRNYLAKAKKIFVASGSSDAPASPALPRSKVRILQKQLHDLGFVEVGTPDGWIGPKTVGSIAAFQAENGLEITGTFDEETQEQLFNARPRVVQRSTAAPAASRIMENASRLKKAAGGAVATGLALSAEKMTDLSADPLAAVEDVTGYVDRARNLLAPLESLLGALSDNWFVVLIGVAAAVYVLAGRIEQARIDDHATGKTS